MQMFSAVGSFLSWDPWTEEVQHGQETILCHVLCLMASSAAKSRQHSIIWKFTTDRPLQVSTSSKDVRHLIIIQSQINAAAASHFTQDTHKDIVSCSDWTNPSHLTQDTRPHLDTAHQHRWNSESSIDKNSSRSFCCPWACTTLWGSKFKTAVRITRIGSTVWCLIQPSASGVFRPKWNFDMFNRGYHGLHACCMNASWTLQGAFDDRYEAETDDTLDVSILLISTDISCRDHNKIPTNACIS